MPIVAAIATVAGLIPLVLALRANRGSSLMHALAWAVIAWLGWGCAFLLAEPDRTDLDAARYCALCLTGCAGVAVLGARRPHVGAWNFVVLGLLAVMLLPLVQSAFIGIHPLDTLHTFFLAMTLAVGILNYLPTRFAPVACLMVIATAAEIVALHAPQAFPDRRVIWAADLLILAAPWLGWICARQHRPERSEFDRLWLTFRDRWGLLWAQRVREQFNHAAENAGWPVRLYWQGLIVREKIEDIEQDRMLATLRATLQRFL